MHAYLLAICSSLVFAVSSVYYTEYARRFSPLWINAVKATVLFFVLTITTLIFESWQPLSLKVTSALLLSGLLGLAIGDIFLLNAYKRIGAARTLILFGFQPLFLGLAAKYIFSQDLNPMRLLSLLFFMGCLYTFSLEKFKSHGHWEILGLFAALIGVIFDNCGVILTRWAFENNPHLGIIQANLLRATGAILFFAILILFKDLKIQSHFVKLNHKEKSHVIIVSFCGTFISLMLYLSAIRNGHLASIAAVGVAGPLFASFYECYKEKKKPTTYLMVALGFFFIGFSLLVFL